MLWIFENTERKRKMINSNFVVSAIKIKGIYCPYLAGIARKTQTTAAMAMILRLYLLKDWMIVENAKGIIIQCVLHKITWFSTSQRCNYWQKQLLNPIRIMQRIQELKKMNTTRSSFWYAGNTFNTSLTIWTCEQLSICNRICIYNYVFYVRKSPPPP